MNQKMFDDSIFVLLPRFRQPRQLKAKKWNERVHGRSFKSSGGKVFVEVCEVQAKRTLDNINNRRIVKPVCNAPLCYRIPPSKWPCLGEFRYRSRRRPIRHHIGRTGHAGAPGIRNTFCRPNKECCFPLHCGYLF